MGKSRAARQTLDFYRDTTAAVGEMAIKIIFASAQTGHSKKEQP